MIKPLLGPCDSYQLEPFAYEWAWTMARAQENNNWAPEEIQVGPDVADYKNPALDPDIASLVALLRKLAYYAHHDVSIAEEAADLIEALSVDAERWRKLCHLLAAAHFLADAQTRGVREALRALDLESLAGRPIAEIFLGLADYICPGAGTVDEGIAREAYIETIVELASEGLTDLTTFTQDQMQTVFELYATHAIEARICNDIGTKAVTMPTDAQAAHRVEQQLRDFIRGGVSDALTRARAETPNLTPERIQGFVDAVYESAFAILQILGDAEANQ